MPDNNLLIQRILGGDQQAFLTLVKDHQRLVSQIVYRMVSGEQDREDICQDVFIKVYENLAGFQQRAKLSTWIARIAYNTALNWLEKKRVPLFEAQAPAGETVDSCAHDDGTPEEWASNRQAAIRLCEEIDRLPVIYGTIVSLYHLHDMTYAEIGDILSLPDGTVKSYLFRARKMLKERVTAAYTREELCA
jgi:RNA polymerase sigma-70 factor (ECF subfamily)